MIENTKKTYAEQIKKMLEEMEPTEEEKQRWAVEYKVYLQEKHRLKRVKQNGGKLAKRRHK